MLKLKVFVLGLVVGSFAAPVLAQNGSIQGVVVDTSGAVIQGAEVIVKNIHTNAHRSVSTSSTGVYSIPNLPVGPYQLDVSANGRYVADGDGPNQVNGYFVLHAPYGDAPNPLWQFDGLVDLLAPSSKG